MANELIIKNGLIVDSGGVQVTGSTTSTQGFIKPGAGNQYLLADGTTTNGTVAPPFPYTGSAVISGSLTITGSLDVTQGITGSLLGTASYATTASYALNAGEATVNTGSLLTTASFNSYTSSDTSQFAGTASYALTASYLAGYVSPFPYTGSAQITGSLGITGSLSNGSGSISTGDYSHAEGGGYLLEGIPLDISNAESMIINGVFLSMYVDPSTYFVYAYGDQTPFFPATPFPVTSLYITLPYGGGSGTVDISKYPTAIVSDISYDGMDFTQLSLDTNPLQQVYYEALSGTNVALGNGSHAEGVNTVANGDGSHTEGYTTNALGNFSHAEGRGTTSIGNFSHAEGASTIASGDYSHAEGLSTYATGDYSHAEGESTQAVEYASHAEGVSTTASGYYSHAEGNYTVAQGYYSHAEGDYTTATGPSSHAEGYNTSATNQYSHAEGDLTIASGFASHAEGCNTIASGHYQHVQGQFNISSSAQSAFIHGNGTSSDTRSNLIFASGSQVQITGSLRVSGSITGSLFGTSSWAVSSSRAISSSYSLTASYALNAGGGGSTFPYTGPAVITGSLIVTNTIQLDKSLTDYVSASSITTEDLNLFNRATGSYTSAFVKYTLLNGTNARAGEFITVWNGTTVTNYDNSTTDIGDTSTILLKSAIVGGDIKIDAAVTAGWTVRALATFI